MPTQSRKTILLATDLQNSVLCELYPTRKHAIAYTPYGDSSESDELQSQLRYNGELQEVLTRNYALGKGYRMYSPALMRFISPDSYPYSPFGKGGINAYIYCGCDPIYNVDLNGHFRTPAMVKGLWQTVKKAFKPARKSVDEVMSGKKARISTTPGESSYFSNFDAESTSSGRTFSSGYESSSLDPEYGIGSSASRRPPNPIHTIIDGVTTNRGRYASHPLPVSEWLDASINTPDPQLDVFSQIPRAGAELHTKQRLATQANGIRKGNRLLVTLNKDRRPSNLPSRFKY